MAEKMVGCVLEVDVNGEELFFVDKEILSSFSNRLSKLFNTKETKTVKVMFHDLPGGATAFELMTRFCYNNGRTQVTPNNTCILHCVAHFMEMKELIKMTEKSLEGILYWSWSEILNALKQCQDFSLEVNSFGIFERILDSLVGKIATASDTSPSDSSPESSGVRFSCDTRSTISMKNSCYRAWWSEDLVGLKATTVEKAVKIMASRRLDHVTISKFLFYYLKCKFSNATLQEKKESTESAINLLYTLDRSCVSCKSLFGILRVSSSLNLSKCCRGRLESMIGSLIDQATLDNLLIPSPTGTDSLYDVNLVVRLLKSFLNNEGQLLLTRLKQVARLVDLYMAEVAPDPCLKPLRFIGVTTALPDSARDSHDAIYRAIDMYLEVHPRLTEEEKMKICCAINFEKLSSESCKHLAHNSRFPSRTAIQALISQQSKLKSLLQDPGCFRSSDHDDEGEQIVIYSKKVDLSMENEKLKSHLQGMHWRVMELEKVCRKMQTQMAKMTKTKRSAHPPGSRSLPRLCS